MEYIVLMTRYRTARWILAGAVIFPIAVFASLNMYWKWQDAVSWKIVAPNQVVVEGFDVAPNEWEEFTSVEPLIYRKFTVTLRNDSPHTITAVRLRVVMRDGDRIVGEDRITKYVKIPPGNTRGIPETAWFEYTPKLQGKPVFSIIKVDTKATRGND